MCLSIPSEILEIDEFNSALVQTLGVKRRVSLDLISEPCEVGDFVLIHVGRGYAKNRQRICHRKHKNLSGHSFKNAKWRDRRK